MARQEKKKFNSGFLVSKVSSDGSRACILKIRCDESGRQSMVLRALADRVCSIALDNPKVLYLDRASVPWDAVRSFERSAKEDACKKCSDYKAIDEFVLKASSDFYKSVCLMEQEFEGGIQAGLYVSRVLEEESLDAEFAELHLAVL